MCYCDLTLCTLVPSCRECWGAERAGMGISSSQLLQKTDAELSVDKLTGVSGSQAPSLTRVLRNYARERVCWGWDGGHRGMKYKLNSNQ